MVARSKLDGPVGEQQRQPVQGINEIVLINDLNQQGLSVSTIAQQVGCDRKTVKKYIERSLEARYDGLRAA